MVEDTWQSKAACITEDPALFFIEEDDDAQTKEYKLKESKKICGACPVRLNCLQSALDNEDRFGVWGGADENQIRRALSIDQYGHPTIRLRDMKCPNCSSKNLRKPIKKTTKTKIRCEDCKLTWWSRKKVETIHVSAEEDQEYSDNMDGTV